ncbi:MAG: hypothetical protein L0H55_13555 [Candidatus Nitrosocosmicus sp.]|nr:hypothetical protein [Candidatus Nitrosocosmicus sp.]
MDEKVHGCKQDIYRRIPKHFSLFITIEGPRHERKGSWKFFVVTVAETFRNKSECVINYNVCCELYAKNTDR